ncbi:MAG: HemK2/MTQ2 family protein methyltransferase [Candidatus Hodarchaeota archaeon]
MMKIPISYDDIHLDVPGDQGIYVPAEDTFLLLDLVKRFLEDNALIVKENDLPVLDMGTGSGIVSLLLSRYFAQVHAIDVNPNAIEFVRAEIGKRGLSCKYSLLNSSLTDSFNASRDAPLYFLACFNPPYLPKEHDNDDLNEITTNEDYLKHALYSSPDGASVLKNFLTRLKDFLKPGGHVFFVFSSLSSENTLEEMINNLDYALKEKTKIHRFFEDIYACHIQKRQ